MTMTTNSSINSNIGIENYFNAKSQNQQQTDLVKDVPSLRSFACSVNEESNKEFEKQLKGKWQLEKAYNKDKIFIPHDGRGLVMIYGGAKDEKKRQ